MTETEKCRCRDFQQCFRFLIHGQRQHMKTALVIVMMIRRTIAFIVIVATFGNGRNLVLTALLGVSRANGAVVSICR